MHTKIATVFLVMALSSFHKASGWGETYRAAVVEYHPFFSKNEELMVAENVKAYADLMKKAREKGADIIVFPELGLNTHKILSPIPDPADNVIPCDHNRFKTTKVVVDLSCASKNNYIYSVINLREKRPCEGEEDCPSRGHYIYNTNVVFDRNGMIIGRYAKFNLFDEVTTNKPKDPEMVFFDTDFGVRFGTFICFDILFTTPALRLVEQFQITDFVFPTYWFSELPFLTALQAQRGWAETNNVNLLASGYNNPSSVSFGSGIYNGKYGALVEIMPERESTKLLIADVPKIQKRSTFLNNLDGEFTFTKPLRNLSYSWRSSSYSIWNEDSVKEVEYLKDQIHLYTSEVIEPGKRFDKEICSRNNFCCTFQIFVEELEHKYNISKPKYNYRAMVSDAVRKFGNEATGGIQSCAVVVCDGPQIRNCTGRAKQIPLLYKFKEIKIKGNFLLRNAFQMPSTLTDGKQLLPLPANKYEFEKIDNEDRRTVSLELLWPVTDLHTFAIWGRDVTRDGENVTVVSNAPLATSWPVFLLVTFALVIFRH